MELAANKYNILMTSTSYPRSDSDWQGIFIRKLIGGLASSGEVDVSLWAPKGPLPASVGYAPTYSEQCWLNTLAEQGGIAHILRSGGIARLTSVIRLLWSLRKVYSRADDEAELFHINWLQNALPVLGKEKPIVISVLGSDYKLLDTVFVARLLKFVMKRNRVVLTPNAEWMVPKLRDLFGGVAEIKYIPFGIDNIWYDLTRTTPENSKDWVVVLRITNKKIGPLFEWGKQIFKDKYKLHLFGPMQEQVEIPDWVNYHGPTTPEDLSVNWFPKVAGLISLSQHDEGRPQIMLEAMAAGLPIIASNISAHRDLLTKEELGPIVKDSREFQLAVNWLGKPENNRLVSSNVRAFAKNEFGNWEDCAQRYIGIYRELLQGK